MMVIQGRPGSVPAVWRWQEQEFWEQVFVPATNITHLIGWGVVLVVGLAVNYASLFYWFLFNKAVGRNVVMLKPAMDAIPSLGMGALFSWVFIMSGQYNLLFGTWMCFYGLAQVAYRNSLPVGIYYGGLGYMICGAGLLLSGAASFVNPWPMGIVFFLGELAGGIVLLKRKGRSVSSGR